MLQGSCSAGLQLEVAKRIGTAARMILFEHIATLVAMRDFKLEGAQRVTKRRIGLQKLQKG